jgi:predicted AlkP superfamily phosphohydrolase/phosphomutase
MVLSVAVPLWLRGPGDPAVPSPPRLATPAPVTLAPRVQVNALVGASRGFIRQRVAAGQLPNFGRLLDRGAVADLATVRPTEAEPAWAAAATGISAPRNGVRSNGRYRASPTDAHPVDVLPEYCFSSALVYQGFVRAEPHTAASLAVRPMWDILSDYELPAGIVGWPLTYPARAERGYLLTDRLDEATSSPLRLADADAADPTTAVGVARAVFDGWQAKPWQDILPAFAARIEERPDLERARWDHAYSEAARELEQRFAPRLTSVRYEALDALGHTNLRAEQPERFGDPRRTDPQRSILDRYYTFVDHEVGHAIRRLAPGDLLLVVSAFGMEPAALSRRLLARLLGVSGLSGTHDEAPDGFLLAYGSNVASGQFRRGAILDLAPTVLYYLGVPVGRDMDGFARTDLFIRSFALERPVKYIASHEK